MNHRKLTRRIVAGLVLAASMAFTAGPAMAVPESSAITASRWVELSVHPDYQFCNLAYQMAKDRYSSMTCMYEFWRGSSPWVLYAWV
ncbi:hypothetical protein [Actinoplanes flavus]|uniref:Uncharacterized protein n=1 Tax=Actinoplanes flavus TaxID=2820290 RepID=A0ABS3UUL6_9ACTN|nr:hypothetical protein [Actinoplanes flavus]MBO3742252.1 hypothetical protein [Actinoplanes flavus]